ncbi:hypothetical protein NEMBOFW57_004535 [Staphylotrichum longicolle]|uniref:Protein kinase domain-containing protein n=1 Tax=Staphylotrichum longicolle TaxID=669026 RepID=A0AAD4F7C0_9PEZI|nr:hypothetical protein NEMBOFW57_004535 [Staphylotrichum longicolle]
MSSLPTVKAGRILAKPMRGSVHIHYDTGDDCVVFIRCNGREFHIQLSPFFFSDSPLITSRYLKFIAALRDRGRLEEDEDPEDIKARFYDWLMAVFEPIFSKLAPDVPPFFDPDMIKRGEAKPLLSEYLFPEVHWCRLEAENDKPFPIHMPDEEKQALDDKPTRVLVDLDGSGNMTTCFFKEFGAGAFMALEKELEAHLRLLKSDVALEARVARLLGVVAAEDDRLAGILLTYVNCRRENDGILDGIYRRRTPIALRERWVSQIREAVQQLHVGGVIWGDATADNVLIDKNNDAWLIDFGGGHTEGWVDKEKADTEEGDLQGVERIAEYLLSEEYESASSDYEFDSKSE